MSIRKGQRPLSALMFASIVSVLALFILGACASSPATTPAPVQPTTAAPTAVSPGGQPTTAPIAPTATSAPAMGNVPDVTAATGIISVARQDVAPGTGLGSAQAPVELLHESGVGEAPFTCDDDRKLAPKLVTEWEVTPEHGILTIREGVPFHKEMGMLTAEDVAWSMNDANAGINLTSIHGQAGDFAALFGDNAWEATDNFTVEFDWFNFDVTALTGFLSDCTQALSIFSKTAYDTQGEDWVRENIIGTGPLQVVSWTENEEAVMEPVPYDHWDHNAQFERLTMLEVPEESTRVALLETGEISGSLELSIQSTIELTDRGFTTASAGLTQQWGIFMLGNYWEENHAITEESLNIAASGVYVNDLPWQGNPYQPNDGNNPDGMDDMEQARLVRQALARAIDRDEINEVIVGGLGYAVPNPYFDPNNSRWQDKWDYPFDPAEAESLLAQAGYPNGYEQPLYVRPENATSVEVAEAVSGYWRDIGLDVPVISYAYSAFRPSVVGRTQTVPWLSTCDEGTNGVPWDWPKAKVMSSITRGGFGCGQESPEIAQWYLEAAAEPDPLVREQINDEVLDYLQNWALNPGTVAIPILAVINPNAIESWDQHTTIRQTITDWDNIVPAN